VSGVNLLTSSERTSGEPCKQQKQQKCCGQPIILVCRGLPPNTARPLRVAYLPQMMTGITREAHADDSCALQG